MAAISFSHFLLQGSRVRHFVLTFFSPLHEWSFRFHIFAALLAVAFHNRYSRDAASLCPSDYRQLCSGRIRPFRFRIFAGGWAERLRHILPRRKRRGKEALRGKRTPDGSPSPQ
jgi:hypothetical protein